MMRRNAGRDCLMGLAAAGMLATVAFAQAPGANSAEVQVRAVLDRYKAAMEARSLDQLAKVMDPDLLLVEGVHKNVGWPDYRDNHIGEHMQEWTDFKVLSAKVIESSVSGDLAYVFQEAADKITTGKGSIIYDEAQTFVLKKGPEGWKIKLLHSAGKKRAAPGTETKK